MTQRVLDRVDLDSLPDHWELTEVEASSAIDRTLSTLRLWRFRKVGPSFIKYGRSVRYRVDDLKKFRDARRTRVESTDLLPGVLREQRERAALMLFGTADTDS